MIPPGAFELVTAPRIVFGAGTLDRLGRLAAELGRSALVVTNADRSGRLGLMGRVQELLSRSSVTSRLFWIRGEPTVEVVDRGLDEARSHGSEIVVGIGGGSSIDTAKAIAGLLTNGGSCLDYMEVIGKGQPVRRPALPWIALPTTAGTGAEVTRNAVIGSTERRYKASIRSPLLLPRVALVDPETGIGVPREVTARSGMDALTQCVESFTSNGANALTDALALEGMRLASRSLRRAVDRPDDLDARRDMALAALISGVTLTNAGLGAVHGLAAPAGAHLPVPHGLVCAVLLPRVVRANVDALRAADPTHSALERYATIGRVLSGDAGLEQREAVDAGPAAAQRLVDDLGLPGLARFGLTESGIPEIVPLAQRASSMRYNPVELPAETLEDILRRAL